MLGPPRTACREFDGVNHQYSSFQLHLASSHVWLTLRMILFVDYPPDNS